MHLYRETSHRNRILKATRSHSLHCTIDGRGIKQCKYLHILPSMDDVQGLHIYLQLSYCGKLNIGQYSATINFPSIPLNLGYLVNNTFCSL